jgi:hypothetical protein
MSRIDGRRGARCSMTTPTTETTQEVYRKLQQLKLWAEHFQIVTCLDEVLPWIASGPHLLPLNVPV